MDRTSRIEWGGIALLLVGGFAIAYFYMPHNHDSLWLLIGAERLLSGGIMPTDVYELNPPSVFAPYVLPAFLAGKDMALAYLFYVVEALGVIGLCWWLMQPSLKKLWPDGSTAISTGFGNLVVLASMIFGAGYGFGQRDHLGFVLIIPFLFWLATSVGQPRPVTTRICLLAFLAACGVVLKVHLALPLLAVVVAELLLTRNVKLALQPALWLFTGWGALLTVLVLAAYPEWFDIAADAMALYGGSNAVVVDHLLYAARFVGGLVVWGLLFRPKGAGAFSAALPYLIAACMGALLSGFVQAKGWPYHYIPFVLVVETVLILGLFHLWRARRIGAVIGTLVLAGWMAQSQVVEYVLHNPITREKAPLTQILDEIAPQGAGDVPKVLALTTSVGVGIGAVVRPGYHWASRSSGQWLAPGLLVLEQADTTSEKLENYRKEVFGDVAEDIARMAPDVIAIEVDTIYPTAADGAKQKFAAYYLSSPVLRKALMGYAKLHEGPDWVVFKRLVEGPAAP